MSSVDPMGIAPTVQLSFASELAAPSAVPGTREATAANTRLEQLHARAKTRATVFARSCLLHLSVATAS